MTREEHDIHIPRRDDDVASWLKARRDEGLADTIIWEAIDTLLDDYRLHADTGTPLGEHACDGPNCGCGVLR